MSPETSYSCNEKETLLWAQKLGLQLLPGHVVTLEGDLGAGKTVVCRGICRGLGFEGPVHSPSYSLVHEYPHDPPIFHLDLYRLQSPQDFYEIGVDYYSMENGITLIEWSSRLQGFPLDISHHIRITYHSDSQRKIELQKLI